MNRRRPLRERLLPLYAESDEASRAVIDREVDRDNGYSYDWYMGDELEDRDEWILHVVGLLLDEEGAA